MSVDGCPPRAFPFQTPFRHPLRTRQASYLGGELLEALGLFEAGEPSARVFPPALVQTTNANESFPRNSRFWAHTRADPGCLLKKLPRTLWTPSPDHQHWRSHEHKKQQHCCRRGQGVCCQYGINVGSIWSNRSSSTSSTSYTTYN